MVYFNIFAIISIVILNIYLYSTKKEVDTIVKREDPKYTGNENNTFDFFRLIKVFLKADSLKKNERKLLKVQLVIDFYLIFILASFILNNFYFW